MDNKVTKRRLSDLLSYEWILIIVTCLAGILLFEFLFTAFSVKLTVGQKFKYYFDHSVVGNYEAVMDFYGDNYPFSYDVLDFSGEQLGTNADLLPTRLSVYEGDVIFTSNIVSETGTEQMLVRSKVVLDYFSGYSYEIMLEDAKNYLLTYFMKDGLTKENAFSNYNEENFDLEKVEETFRVRMKKDNRYRKEEQIILGINDEYLRVKSLYKEVLDFERLISYKEQYPDLFVNYTLYEQGLYYARATQADSLPQWEEDYKREVDAGRINLIYALNLDELSRHNPTGKKINPSRFVNLEGKNSAEKVCLTVFNFREQQPHLQFEAIPFINTLVRECSDLLD